MLVGIAATLRCGDFALYVVAAVAAAFVTFQVWFVCLNMWAFPYNSWCWALPAGSGVPWMLPWNRDLAEDHGRLLLDEAREGGRAGLDDDGKPFLSGMDLIGAPVYTDDFVVSGTATGNMYGMCETLYKPDMGPEELFETLSQALLASVDRDALSGWGAVVHIITKDGVISRELKARQD